MEKVTACMIALNEGEFIGYNLRHHLRFPWIDQFIVVEGAVEKYAHAANGAGRSADGTIEIVRDIQRNDPDGRKVELHSGQWKDKREQRAEYLKYVRNGWILLIDADEFYKQEEIGRVVRFAQEEKASCVMYPHIHFWHDFWHYGNARQWHKTQLRFSMFERGWKYVVHYTISDAKGRKPQWDKPHYKKSRWYTANCVNLAYPKADLAPNILPFDCSIYHYGYARSRRYVADKLMFYRKRDKKSRLPDDELRQSVMGASSWFDGRWARGENCDPKTVKKFKGTHPAGMRAHPRHSEVLIRD